MEKMKRIPNKDILNKLRVSLDVLNDDEEKNVFSDIAHLFIGMDEDYVLKILPRLWLFLRDRLLCSYSKLSHSN